MHVQECTGYIFKIQVDIWKHCADFTSASTSVYHTRFSWFHSTHWTDVWNGQRKHQGKSRRLHSSICQTRSKPFWNFDLYYWRTEIFHRRLRDSIYLTVMLVSLLVFEYQGHKVIQNVWSIRYILENFCVKKLQQQMACQNLQYYTISANLWIMP